MQYIAISMIRTENVRMRDKTVLNLIPFTVFPDKNCLICCITDDIFFHFSRFDVRIRPKYKKTPV